MSAQGPVMTNVIPFVARADTHLVADPVETARTTAAVVADLVSVVAEIKELSGKVLPLPYDARVGITSRSSANIEQACAELGGVFGFAADLTSADDAAAMIEAMESRLGPADILVNCAGAARRTPPDELTPAAWKAAMEAK